MVIFLKLTKNAHIRAWFLQRQSFVPHCGELHPRQTSPRTILLLIKKNHFVNSSTVLDNNTHPGIDQLVTFLPNTI